MQQPLKSEAISRFLKAKTHFDLASSYNAGMEVQVNVARGNGKLIQQGEFKGREWNAWTDGTDTWKPFRIPLKANSEPLDNDTPINYSLDLHAEGIGMTGWDWKQKKSMWVAFDFDAIIGHSDKHGKRLDDAELARIQDVVKDTPFVTLRKSTSGKGLHLYVYLDPVETANHTEHAALARAILSMLSGITGFDFASKVDVCVPKDTWVFTVGGPRQVRELINKSVDIIVNGETHNSTGFFSTGQKEVFKIKTSEGFEIKATAEHPLLTGDGTWRRVDCLKIGHKLRLNKHKNVSWEGEGSFEEGYILGWLFGDGFFASKRPDQHGLCFFPDDRCLLDYVKNLFTNPPSVYPHGDSAFILHSEQLEELRVKFGLDTRKIINEHIEQASSEFLSGFVSAFFDTDGGVRKDKTHIQLTQSDLPRLQAVQRILLRFGIFSYIRLERKAGQMNIMGRICNTKNKYSLTIGRENVLIFNERIGFKNPVKQSTNQKCIDEILNRGYGKQKLAKEKFDATIISIESCGTEEVFDIQVPGLHAFDANGFVAHNCGGNMWVWHRKMYGADGTQNEGLKLIKMGARLSNVPANWRDHINVVARRSRTTRPSFVEDLDVNDPDRLFAELTGQRTRVTLESSHRALIDWLGNNGCVWWWDSDSHMLVTHTTHLKEAKDNMKMCGRFETIATGKDKGMDHNCFAFPLRGGAWAVRRYSLGTKEADTWEQDSAGWTKCVFNREPDFFTLARLQEGIEDDKGVIHFRHAESVLKILTELGIACELPNFVLSRCATIKPMPRDGKLAVSIGYESSDDGSKMKGWLNKKKEWQKVFKADLHNNSDSENQLNYDDVLRHIVSMDKQDAGWVMFKDGTWVGEPLVHVKAALASYGRDNKEITQIVGTGVMRAWQLVNKPFQPEYPGNREWNRNAAQFAVAPSNETDMLSYPTWMKVLEHCGIGLDDAIKEHEWCQSNGITKGSEYLMLWIASMFKRPDAPTSYLAFWGPQDSGKSIFHEMISQVLVTKGVMRADNALQSSSNFNGELENAILCVIEETDLRKDKIAYNRIKDWVTSPEIMIRPLYTTGYMSKNTTHWIQCCNEPENVAVFPGDTRITMIFVDAIPKADMIPKDELLQMLRKEAPDFLAALLAMELPKSNDRLAVPTISTEGKLRAAAKNESLLEQFLREFVFDIPGQCIKGDEFHEKFVLWLEERDRAYWTRQRMGRELPERYPRGRLSNDQLIHFGNMSWNAEAVPGTPYKLIKSGTVTYIKQLQGEAVK